jgi:hypothetical protein
MSKENTDKTHQKATKKNTTRIVKLTERNAPATLLHLRDAASNLVGGFENEQGLLLNMLQHLLLRRSLLRSLQGDGVRFGLRNLQVVHVEVQLNTRLSSPSLTVNNLHTMVTPRATATAEGESPPPGSDDCLVCERRLRG